MLPDIPHRRRVCVTVLSGFFLFVISALSLMAQGVGELTGTVTDPAAAPVVFAMITTTSVGTGQVLPAATRMDGTYKFSLPPGNYRLTFESPGYKTVEISAAKISVIKTVVQDCKLEANVRATSGAPPPPPRAPVVQPPPEEQAPPPPQPQVAARQQERYVGRFNVSNWLSR